MANSPISMTTIFTPPPDCTASLTYLPTSSYLVLGAGSSCVPSGAGPLGSDQIFSPALKCPLGWTVAATTTLAVGYSVTETLATCCPLISQFSLVGDIDMLIDTDYYDYECQAMVTGSILSEIVWNGTSTYTTSTFWNVTYPNLLATSIQIAWQATDLIPRTSVSSSHTPTSTVAAASAISIPRSSGGLSTTAKIVVGVLVPVVIIALLVALGFFIINRRKSKQRSTAHEIQQEITQYDPAYDHDPHAANRMLNDGFHGSGGANTPGTHIEKSPNHHSRPTTVSLT